MGKPWDSDQAARDGLPEETSKAVWAGGQGLQAQVPMRDRMGRNSDVGKAGKANQTRSWSIRQAGPSCLEAPGIHGPLPHQAKFKSTETIGKNCSMDSRANDIATQMECQAERGGNTQILS